MTLNSLIRVLTVLKKLLRHPVIDQQQVNGLHVTSLVITVNLLAEKVIKVLEYSFFSSNRASKRVLMFCNDLL